MFIQKIQTLHAQVTNRSRASHTSRILVVLIVLAAFVTACGTSNSKRQATNVANTPPATTKLVTIKIAEVPRLLEMFLVHLAAQKGFMQQEGLSPQFISVSSGPDLITSILGGNANIALASPPLFWPAIKKGANIVSLVGTIKLNYVLATCGTTVAPNAGAPFPQNLRGVKGKTVGVIAPGTATEIWVEKLLAAAGLKPNVDYKIVYLGPPATGVPACEAGRADFYTFAPPSEALVPGAKVIADSLASSSGGLFTHVLTTVYAATGSYAASHPSVISGFCKAVVKAKQFALNPVNETQVVDLLAQDTGVSITAARAVWPEESQALLPAITSKVWSAQTILQLPPLTTYVPSYSKYVSPLCTSIVSGS